MKRFLLTIAPPGILLILYPLAFAASRWTPLGRFSFGIPAFGYLSIALGIFLFVWAGLQFRRHTTTILPIGQPSRLIKHGPYRFSRNPIYLADMFITVGLALCLGTLPYWLVPALLFWALNRALIPQEEEKMRATFGEDFESYAEQVNRWM